MGGCAARTERKPPITPEAKAQKRHPETSVKKKDVKLYLQAYEAGDDLFNRKLYFEAEQKYRESIRHKQNFPEAYFKLGQTLVKRYRFEAAVKAFQKAIRIRPDYLAAYEELAIVLSRLERYEESVTVRRKAIRLDPDNPATFNNLANILKELRRYEAAEKAYLKSIEINANISATHHNLGTLYFTLARYEDAERALRTCLNLEPDFYEAGYSLGRLLELQGRYDEAEKLYRRVLSIKADDYNAKKRLTYLLEIKAHATTPKEYKPYKNGLVGGVGWIFGYNLAENDDWLTEARKKKADQMFEAQRKLAGISREDFIDRQEYGFIIGMASGYNTIQDLVGRALKDQNRLGRFTSKNRKLYYSIRHRQFDRLDCHSNGAMICLAALELEDVKARHVRLFGPQITSNSLRHWQALIEKGKIGSLILYINKRDPVPSASYIWDRITRKRILFMRNVPSDFQYLSVQNLKKEINRLSPGINVRINDCTGDTHYYFDIENCHSFKSYQENLK